MNSSDYSTISNNKITNETVKELMVNVSVAKQFFLFYIIHYTHYLHWKWLKTILLLTGDGIGLWVEHSFLRAGTSEILLDHQTA